MVECDKCGRQIRESEKYQYHSQTLCEECYIDARFSAKACDPWAVYSATRFRQRMGLKNAQGLTELQRAIYDFVKSRGKVAKEKLLESFNLAESELQVQLAILRHCQLVKAFKEDGRIYIAPF